MSILLKEIERIEALAEDKRDAVKLANFWKMYALELRDEKNSEIALLKLNADRYVFLRGYSEQNIGTAGMPVIAVPETEHKGVYLSGIDADVAVDNAMASAIPKCDKCGAEVTTGLMAAFCPQKEQCEFYVEGIEDFMESVSVPKTSTITNDNKEVI
jgi:hypothetical protein